MVTAPVPTVSDITDGEPITSWLPSGWSRTDITTTLSVVVVFPFSPSWYVFPRQVTTYEPFAKSKPKVSLPIFAVGCGAEGALDQCGSPTAKVQPMSCAAPA